MSVIRVGIYIEVPDDDVTDLRKLEDYFLKKVEETEELIDDVQLYSVEVEKD